MPANFNLPSIIIPLLLQSAVLINMVDLDVTKVLVNSVSEVYVYIHGSTPIPQIVIDTTGEQDA